MLLIKPRERYLSTPDALEKHRKYNQKRREEVTRNHTQEELADIGRRVIGQRAAQAQRDAVIRTATKKLIALYPTDFKRLVKESMPKD